MFRVKQRATEIADCQRSRGQTVESVKLHPSATFHESTTSAACASQRAAAAALAVPLTLWQLFALPQLSLYQQDHHKYIPCRLCHRRTNRPTSSEKADDPVFSKDWDEYVKRQLPAREDLARRRDQQKTRCVSALSTHEEKKEPLRGHAWWSAQRKHWDFKNFEVACPYACSANLRGVERRDFGGVDLRQFLVLHVQLQIDPSYCVRSCSLV